MIGSTRLVGNECCTMRTFAPVLQGQQGYALHRVANDMLASMPQFDVGWKSWVFGVSH